MPLRLETKMGSEAFAKLLLGLLVATQCTAVVGGFCTSGTQLGP